MPILLLKVSSLLLLFAAVSAHATPYVKTASLVVFGDSISAAYGLDPAEGWVSLLEQRLAETYPGVKVINASVSGETTGGGLVRLPKTLELHQPDILVLELGGNDGLRGYPIDTIRANLLEMSRLAHASGAKVLLVGMVLPPNYGRRYTQAFEQVFEQVADTLDVPLVPYLLQGTDTNRELLQDDGIHPTASAQGLLLEDIWPRLEALVKSLPGKE